MSTPVPLRELSSVQADELALRLAREHRLEEPLLMTSRWWDYRLLHPTVATYLFADLYEAARKDWWERYIDIRAAKTLKPLWTDVFDSPDLTAVWLARQTADRYGLPYDFVLEYATTRALKREFRHVLRPNQLYGEEFESDLLAAWAVEQSAKLRIATLPYFSAAEYRAHPIQVEYRSWLIKLINDREGPRYRLLARLLRDGVVSAAMIENEWGNLCLFDTLKYLGKLQSD